MALTPIQKNEKADVRAIQQTVEAALQRGTRRNGNFRTGRFKVAVRKPSLRRRRRRSSRAATRRYR